jgi:hypothetical protein
MEVVFCYMDVLDFVCPFTPGRTFGLFIGFGH